LFWGPSLKFNTNDVEAVGCSGQGNHSAFIGPETYRIGDSLRR
jgi:hypothetical protein